MLKVAFTNWKTTSAGVIFGVLLAFQTNYKPGMSLKEWVYAVVVALAGSLPGILAHDGFAPAP